MLEFIYQTGWGAFAVLLFFQLPFVAGFLYIVFKRIATGSGSGAAAEPAISRAKTLWLSVVVVLFVAINVASIQFIPAVSTAFAVASDPNIQEVKVTAESWSYDLSEREFVTGRPVRFTANAVDTVHGFAIYHPEGKILFTMMLVPGVTSSSLIYTFKDSGTYKIRCLEYCGIAHHDMSDEIVVKPNAG